MTSPNSEDSATALEEAKEELARRMEEACESGIGSSGLPETTGELLKLEDKLVAAARATEDVLAARRRAQEAGAAHRDEGGAHTGDEEVPIDHSRDRIREFRDSTGQDWRVWAVTPGMASPTSQRYLGDLKNGWLAFEALSGNARRRLVSYPADWIQLDDVELERLLGEAAVAPIRKRPEAGA